MKKSTALEILRRYSAYSIVTVGRPDICDTIVTGNGQPVYEVANLVFLWDHNGDIAPFEGEASKEHPIRDYFTIESYADYLDTKNAPISPWSEHGDLGGRHTGLYSLLPPDLDRVLFFLSYRATRRVVKWTPDDESDLKALGAGQRYVGMGDWTPSQIAFDPVARSLDWDCAASAECRRQEGDVDFRLTWNVTTRVADPATGAGLIAVSWRTSQRSPTVAESLACASINPPSKPPEPDTNLLQSWDDATSEMMLDRHETPKPAGAFDAWFDEEIMSRLADSIDWMRLEIKCRRFLNRVNGGFCCLGVLSINADGLVLGCEYGAIDDASNSVTWRSSFVPKSLLIDRTLNSDQLGDRILDLDSKITADLNVDYNPDEDEDLLGEPDPDDEEAYVRERCENFPTKEETI